MAVYAIASDRLLFIKPAMSEESSGEVRMTEESFKKALTKLLEEHEISQRELIRRTRKHGWGSQGYLSTLMANDTAPSIQAMEAFAQALQIKPEYFAEYRLAKARTCLDPDVVGLFAALHGLEAAKAALEGK